MARETQLAFLKADLGRRTVDAMQETYLRQLLATSESRLSRMGVTLDEDDIDDDQLVAMHAAWLYRKRDSGIGMPEMLRTSIRNRKVHEVTRP